jgi:hypothetical protein
MHRLTADTECVGDGLPTPALIPGIRDVDGLQPFLQPLQCAHRTQAGGRIGASGGVGDGAQGLDVSHLATVTPRSKTCQETLTTGHVRCVRTWLAGYPTRATPQFERDS